MTGVGFFGYPLFGQTDAGGQPVGHARRARRSSSLRISGSTPSRRTQRRPQSQAGRADRDHRIPHHLHGPVRCRRRRPHGHGPLHPDQRNAGVSEAFKTIGLPWAEVIIAAAGVAGITSVLLVMMLSGPRVLPRDGARRHGPRQLLQRRASRVSAHRGRAPSSSAIFVAVLSGLLPIDALLHLANIGTLLAFVIVCAAVLIMRKTHPEAERPFRAPFSRSCRSPASLSSLLLMFSLPVANWWRLFVWLGIGFVIYFLYGRKHSVLARMRRRREMTAGAP